MQSSPDGPVARKRRTSAENRTSARGKQLLIMTFDGQGGYNKVKIYSKKLQIALANVEIKWYIIYKPAEGAVLRAPAGSHIDYKYFIYT